MKSCPSEVKKSSSPIIKNINMSIDNNNATSLISLSVPTDAIHSRDLLLHDPTSKLAEISMVFISSFGCPTENNMVVYLVQGTVFLNHMIKRKNIITNKNRLEEIITKDKREERHSD